MSKQKSVFFCTECGYESAKWLGKCPACNTWNTFKEEKITKSVVAPAWEDKGRRTSNKPMRLHEISGGSEKRLPVTDGELSRVLGGGIVAGSVILIGGEPGIGKSTLMLQLGLMTQNLKTLYISGEESAGQIKMRASRLKMEAENCYFLTETSTQSIFEESKKLKPGLLIVDSIQTMQSAHVDAAPGSIMQIRQTASELIRYAKETDTPVFLVGHITKDGAIAGPKVLEHMVDTVLQFEGDQHFTYRILRTVKNRFGAASEIGIYEMWSSGLREVTDPSQVLVSHKEEGLSGVAISAMIEGNRPLLIETQSLVSPATYGTPQRSSTGFDAKRLNMLLAVLERRCGFRLGQQDVFVNMAGGIKVMDPAVDLAICVSIVSSMEDMPVPEKICYAAEIGLGGELRAVGRIENRVAEAAKLGYKTIYISKHNTLQEKTKGITVKQFGKLNEVLEDMFG